MGPQTRGPRRILSGALGRWFVTLHEREGKYAAGSRNRGRPFVEMDEAFGTVPNTREEKRMTQYLLAVHSVEGEAPPSPEVMQVMYHDVNEFNAELQAKGAWVFAGGLHPVDTATVVRATAGEVQLTDGPFAETKEHLGGVWIIEAPDLDAALAWAAKGSAARRGPVEVRPFQEVPEG
jgi:hypothetical protein